MSTQTGGSSLSIIVPCFNEEGGILKSITDLISHLPQAEIIIVDDCSTDGTANILKDVKNVRVVTHEFNKGYGASLKTGMRTATKKYIAWFDADNEHRASDLVKMYSNICETSSAAVIGARDKSTSGIRRFGKLMIKGLARLMGTSLGKDINCGLRVMERTSIIPYLSVLPNGFSASLTTTMILIHKNRPISFQPIETNHRIGTSKVELIHGFETLIFVLRLTMLFEPIRVFVIPGLLVLMIATVYGIIQTLNTGLGFPTFAAVMFISGAYLVALGLIADQISQSRLQGFANDE